MLPAELHHFFWEYHPEDLDLTQQRHLIIERILEYGDLPAYRWLLKTCSYQQIAEVVRKSRNLSRRTASLWQNLLDIPKKEVLCLNISSLLLG